MGRSYVRSVGLFGKAQENQSSGQISKVMVLQSKKHIRIVWVEGSHQKLKCSVLLEILIPKSSF